MTVYSGMITSQFHINKTSFGAMSTIRGGAINWIQRTKE